jgi:tetratricopeptide (TPR) repeat protein/predicted Ser/Thr protein kinase
MESERWRRVRAIVEEALEFQGDAAALERRLHERCDGDAPLLREVRELLAADDESALLPPPAANVAQLVNRSASRDAQAACGTRAGPYVLERVLGVGGMGVVYLARRADVDFDQVVALKLVKRGMDTDEVVRRFHRERALLASLQHSGIARLYDGGSTADGRPWLALEYVDGLSLERWCDERRASTVQRIELFQKVCAAVAFAHRNMVVHRDIKPSNILVTADGSPKLLDFGLAKLLHGDEREQRELTQAGQRPLTPAYASPEQLRGEALTSATDVYSLGLVLYELLCGARAHEGATATRERPPPRRLSTCVTPEAAAARASDARKLRRALTGELETVVATALADDPLARYATVDALAADLERFRRGLPIEARPASALYRISKFAARNRVLVAAAVLVFASLVGGLGFSLRANRTAQRARDAERGERQRAELGEREARLAAARANAALQIVQGIFEAAGSPDELAPERTVRSLLDDFDARWRDRASTAPEVEAAVRETVGAAYSSLGLPAKARPHLERALELASGPNGDPHLALRARLELVRTLIAEASYDQALELADELEAELRAAGRGPPAELAQLCMQRASAHTQRGEFEQARDQAARALEHVRASAERDVAAEIGALAMIGQGCSKAGRLEEAEAALRESLALHERIGRPDTLGTAAIRHELGGVLLQSSRFDEAQSLLEAALELRRTLAGPRHPSTGESLGQLGRVLTERHDVARALPLLEDSLAIALESLPREHPNVATAMARLADAKRVARDLKGALPLYRESLEIRRALYGERHPVVARSLGNLGFALRLSGERVEAEQHLRAAIELRRGMEGEQMGLAANLEALGALMGDLGRLPERLELEREAIALLRAELPASADSLSIALLSHGNALQESKRGPEAVPLFEEGLELRRQVHGERSARYARALSDLGSAHMYTQDPTPAPPLLERALALQRELLGPNDLDLALTLERLASALRMVQRNEESLPYWSEALERLREAVGPDHARTKRVRQRYALTLREMGRETEAASVEGDR